jgi:hypothetical protein
MAYIKLAPYNAPSAWKSAATAVLPGSSDQNLINSYAVPWNTVEIGPGNVKTSGVIQQQTNSSLISLNNTIIQFDTSDNNGIYINNVGNIEFGGFTITGTAASWLAGVVFIAGTTANYSGFNFHDLIFQNCPIFNNLFFYAYNYKLSNIVISRCQSLSPDGFSVMLGGGGSGIIDTVAIYRHYVVNAGLAVTRYNPWVTGLDLAEGPVAINNVTLFKCAVNYAFESDYHWEYAPTKQGIVIIDCTATGAGQKPSNFDNGDGTIGPQYGAGFILPFQAGRDDFIINGCTGGPPANVLGDLRVWNGSGYTNYTPPVNLTMPAGRIITRITQGNCTGIAETKGSTYDLYLYSTDGNPVSQNITLPNGNSYTAAFTDFLIAKAVSGNPPGTFTHGTTHTAKVTLTITPSNLACQMEVWLGPNASTKSATSGLVNFTTTSAAQAVNATVTMPAAGTYNTYIDIYYGGQHIQGYIDAKQLVIV